MKHLIVANWKMNPDSLKEAKRLFDAVKREARNLKNTEVVICPPFVYLLGLVGSVKSLASAGLLFGSQDCFWEEKGAFTGQISAKMLKNLGCRYVIIGHSEKRVLGETDEILNKKIRAAQRAGLIPILCVGETQKECKNGSAKEYVQNQIINALEGLSVFEKEKVIIAYEPVWAIGKENCCETSVAKDMASFIRGILPENKLIYGGSVNSENAKNCLKGAGFLGLLVGGASLDPGEFIAILESVQAQL